MKIKKQGTILVCAAVMFGIAYTPASYAEQPNLKLNNTYSGFRLTEESNVQEINSEALIFEHIKSGARLLYIKNTDDNKVFSIAFRTLPEGSTGVAHILEHSVLCGSRKFPVKEPFVEMMKSSLNTFLNAMTYPDKTVYPVASRNDKDFRNLMDVYMDAVLYPNIYQKPQIFAQEGWHYELKDEASIPSYNGVVYNEMKGVYSSPEALLEHAITKSLLPDTIYAHSSGGDPEVIPSLTYAKFLDFHRTYYHPSNSYIFLYGNLDILDALEFLDTEYLSAFDKTAINSRIKTQKALPTTNDVTITYPIAAAEKPENKTYLTMNYLVGEAGDLSLSEDFGILETILLGSDDAPLKRAIMNAGIGQNVYSSYDDLLQPTFSITVTNANENQKEALKKIVQQTLQELIQKGIDKKLIKSAFSIAEFKKRDVIANAQNKGLMYNFASLSNWLYDKDPIAPLAYRAGSARKISSKGYFENIIKKYLLDNPFRSSVTAIPQQGLEEKKAAETKLRLKEYKESLSASQISGLIKETTDLKTMQTAPDSEEDLSKMPSLSPQDICKTVEKIPYEEKNEAGTTLLYTPQFTNGITYFNLNFSTKAVPESKLPYLYLLAELFGEVNTEKYAYEDLTTELKTKTGGISFTVNAVTSKTSEESYQPYLAVTAKALNANAPAALELTEQIINHSNFTDNKRLLELIKKIKAQRETQLQQKGTMVSINRAMSYISPAFSYRAANDLPFYQFISALEKDFSAKAPEVLEELNAVRALVFNKQQLLTNVVAAQEDYVKFQPHFTKFINTLSTSTPQAEKYQFTVNAKNEGFFTAGKVQFVTKVFDFCRLGYEYSGKMKVLQTILNTNYLWNNVRVLGGAYGASFNIDRSGSIFFTSWRDPNLTGTLTTYDAASDFLNNFTPSEREMSNYIIATIGKLDTPLSPYDKGAKITRNYLRGITYEDQQKEREEILHTTPEDIRNFAKMFTRLKEEQNYICVVGNEAKLQENKEHFGSISPLKN